MSDSGEWVSKLEDISSLAQFNNWLGLEIVAASEGHAELAIDWKPEMGQYSGFLHAGIQGALIDTACGFAAATLAGRVLASQFTVRCLRPAEGERFRVVARVVKPGKQQIFTTAELFALQGGEEKLVATGDTLLVPA